MEIDKSLQIASTPEKIWAILLDPQAMAACVPGMQSVEIISPDEYAALMQVKIAFVSAKFKLRTRIVERREPVFLKAEGTGEDASVASSLKQVTEVTLTPQPDGSTQLHINVKVDLLGRMGSFGLSVMKTKADRLWDEFGVNLSARLAGENPSGADAGTTAASQPSQATQGQLPPLSSSAPSAGMKTTSASSQETNQGLWAVILRALGIQPAMHSARHQTIVVEVQRPDQTRIKVEWPAAQSQECQQWLRELMR